jgi:hypothetical protein
MRETKGNQKLSFRKKLKWVHSLCKRTEICSTSSENILHYFDARKTAWREQWFRDECESKAKTSPAIACTFTSLVTLL